MIIDGKRNKLNEGITPWKSENYFSTSNKAWTTY